MNTNMDQRQDLILTGDRMDDSPFTGGFFHTFAHLPGNKCFVLAAVMKQQVGIAAPVSFRAAADDCKVILVHFTVAEKRLKQTSYTGRERENTDTACTPVQTMHRICFQTCLIIDKIRQPR